MIKPLNHYVALQAIEEQEEVTASGIYLGTTNKSKQPVGKVVAVKKTPVFSDGPKGGSSIFFSMVEVGDIVYYKNGIEIKDGNDSYILVEEKDLIAKRGEEE